MVVKTNFIKWYKCPIYNLPSKNPEGLRVFFTQKWVKTQIFDFLYFKQFYAACFF